MPTTRFYPKVTHTNLGDAIPQIVRFLIDDHASITGPGWTIVEARSNSSREVPGDPTNLDSLASATDWSAGSISTGDWIVLESADANNSNHFQLYIKYNSSTEMHLKLIPFEDFTTGGGDTASPTLPTTSVGAGSSVVSFSVIAGSANMTIVADEGMMALLWDNGVDNDARWTYVGEVDYAQSGGTPADDRAYIIWDNPFQVHLSSSGSGDYFNRVSPLDDTTIIEDGFVLQYTSPAGGNLLNGAPRGNLLGLDHILPAFIWFQTIAHYHLTGVLRNVYMVHDTVGTSGTLDSLNYMYRNDGNTDPAVCFAWDGSTAY